ncbi:hypothetical protein EXE58_15560 [Nocardioides seonyuensis]|uniref:Uncharacterized protein n=1 Tax=Nocardioides seonyuensis TaxID=2518371 RepID=A0A4P7IJ01_9ACTN|nr:hypothetical protein [Nocardioides seonyuensis]QBX56733.1 hypothetical protein EXE58_15560 [Nocardioides seonyuensis]
MMHVEVHVDCLSVALGADGRADEAVVRQALDDALRDRGGLGDRPVTDVVARTVAREVAREVGRTVPPC